MKRNPIETMLGAVVLLVSGMFLFLAYSTAQIEIRDGTKIEARFLKVGGLQVGSDVRISGVNVGTVESQRLDLETYEAKVLLVIDKSVSIPSDTVAAIVGDGLLGGKYVDLRPGLSSTLIKGGGSLEKTVDFQSLEDLLGEIMFLATGGES